MILLKDLILYFGRLKKNNKDIGKVTSAVYSPRLKKNIALAMIAVEESQIGNLIDVEINGINIKGKIVEKPFYDPKKNNISKIINYEN